MDIQTQLAEVKNEVEKSFEFEQTLQKTITRQVELVSQLEFRELLTQETILSSPCKQSRNPDPYNESINIENDLLSP